MAACMSSWSLFWRVTGCVSSGLGPLGRLLVPSGLLALRFLALALDAGLLVVLASASLGEDATLLDLLVEASQGTLEGLVFAYTNFSQFRNHLPMPDFRRGLMVCHSLERRPV